MQQLIYTKLIGIMLLTVGFTQRLCFHVFPIRRPAQQKHVAIMHPTLTQPTTSLIKYAALLITVYDLPLDIEKSVFASWYGSESGNRTAMGTRFMPHDLTAAHKTLLCLQSPGHQPEQWPACRCHRQ